MLNSSRRDFLIGVLKRSGQISLASATLYSISLLTAGHGPFGGMTAGAKCVPPQIPVGPFCCDSVFVDSNGQTICI